MRRLPRGAQSPELGLPPSLPPSYKQLLYGHRPAPEYKRKRVLKLLRSGVRTNPPRANLPTLQTQACTCVSTGFSTAHGLRHPLGILEPVPADEGG